MKPAGFFLNPTFCSFPRTKLQFSDVVIPLDVQLTWFWQVNFSAAAGLHVGTFKSGFVFFLSEKVSHQRPWDCKLHHLKTTGNSCLMVLTKNPLAICFGVLVHSKINLRASKWAVFIKHFPRLIDHSKRFSPIHARVHTELFLSHSCGAGRDKFRAKCPRTLRLADPWRWGLETTDLLVCGWLPSSWAKDQREGDRREDYVHEQWTIQ